MHIIHLHQLHFFAYHGVYEEEKIIGNNFEVNADISFNVQTPITNLSQTINYATIYEVIKKRMTIPTALLETLTEDMAHQIQLLDKRIQHISITIKKLNPPIPNFCGSVAVSYQKNY